MLTSVVIQTAGVLTDEEDTSRSVRDTILCGSIPNDLYIG